MTQFVEREYQTDAIERSIAFLKYGLDGSSATGGLVVQPTGSGKSLVIAGIAKGLDAPLLVFQPSKEILEQNASKLIAYGFNPSVYSASMGLREIGSVTLATIGSVKNNPALFEQFPYVVIDEAHVVNAKEGMYKTFLDYLGDIRLSWSHCYTVSSIVRRVRWRHTEVPDEIQTACISKGRIVCSDWDVDRSGIPKEA